MTNIPYELAVKMQSLGYTVIPGGGGDKGKKPLVNWEEYQTKVSTLDQVLDWEKAFHPRAWGIVTGQTSGVFEIDDDTPGGSSLFNGTKPNVRTPRGGFHRFYKYPNFKVITKAHILPNIDCRGEGGFSQFAGITPEGSYELLELPMPDILPTFNDLPDAIKTALRNKELSQPVHKNSGTLFQRGERNDKLHRIASALRSKGMSEASIFDAVKSMYEHDCTHEPEITDKELHTIAESAGKYPVELTHEDKQNSFQLTKLSDLFKEPEEEKSYIWKDTLPTGGLSILVAKPKVGKSTLARNLAYKSAKGEQSFLGRDITVSGSVIYLALEEKRSQVKKHFLRMGATENLPIFIHTGRAPEQALIELRKAITENQAILAIVDPLQRLVRISDLNDYSRVSLALEPLMQIARDTNCHILLIHHANKGLVKEGGDSILGSTALFGSVDCALIMKRSESYRTIETIQRYGEDMPRTVLTFDVKTGMTGSGGSVEDVEIAECEKDIMEIISHEMTEKELKDGITDHKGGMVSKSLRTLCQEGKILKKGEGKKGNPYQYTKNTGDSKDNNIEIPTIPNNVPESKVAEHQIQNAGDAGIQGKLI